MQTFEEVREWSAEDDNIDRALRPQSFDDYVGQDELTQKLDLAIDAAKERDEPVDHLLLFGPPGLGKTTIANVAAKESGCNTRTVAAPSVKSVADLMELLVKLKHRDILFIDEIHRLDMKVEEVLYSAMEDYTADLKLGNKEISKIVIEPFCLMGATTAPGKMSAPLRDRFGIVYTMQFYTNDELAIILEANARKLDLKIDSKDALLNLAERSRGTPRIANRLLRRVRDYAQVKNNNVLDIRCVNAAMSLEGIDEEGLSKIDHKYLKTIRYTYGTGPVGAQAMSATIGEDKSTVEDYIEPFLIRKGFIARGKSGRLLTGEGMKYVSELEKVGKL